MEYEAVLHIEFVKIGVEVQDFEVKELLESYPDMDPEDAILDLISGKLREVKDGLYEVEGVNRIKFSGYSEYPEVNFESDFPSLAEELDAETE
jgi:hypothetical protein